VAPLDWMLWLLLLKLCVTSISGSAFLLLNLEEAVDCSWNREA